MLQEQRDAQKTVTGHEFGTNMVKLVGVSAYEGYNPLKKFYAMQHPQNGKEEKSSKNAKKHDSAADKKEKAAAAETASGPNADLDTISDKAHRAKQEKQAGKGSEMDATWTSAKGGSAATGQKAKQSTRFRHPKLVSNVFYTKYQIVRKVMRHDFKMRIEEADTDDFDILWCDHGLPPERIMRMKAYQRTNHFPGMQALTRKNSLGKNLNGMRTLFPEAFDFYP